MKIAVLRALQLDDMLCAVPALRALDAAYPQAQIVLVGLPWARQFVARFRRYLDAFIEFPGFPGMPGRVADLSAFPRFFATVRGAGFDLALQLHGSGEFANPLVTLMGARATGGYYRPERYCPDAGRFLQWRDREDEVLRCLRLLSHLGVPSRGDELEFPLEQQDFTEINSARLGTYAVLHPGSQPPSRRWSPERFAAVGDALSRDGMRVVLTGTAGEAGLTRSVLRAMHEPAVDFAGRTSLGGLGALIRRARLLVSNDSAVSHIAAALKTPSAQLERFA